MSTPHDFHCDCEACVARDAAAMQDWFAWLRTKPETRIPQGLNRNEDERAGRDAEWDAAIRYEGDPS